MVREKNPWVAFTGSSTHYVAPFWVFFRLTQNTQSRPRRAASQFQTVAVLLAHNVSLAGDQPTPRQRVYLAQDDALRKRDE